MKKLYALTLFLIGTISTNAQEWAPIGTEWYYEHHFWSTPDIDFNHWVSVKDTTVNGQNCRVIEKTRFSCDFRPDKNFMYGENRRIYFFNEITANFEVLYDFNLQAGDSLVVPNWMDESWENEPDLLVYRIDSIGTFTWNDSVYLKQYMSYDLGNGGPPNIVIAIEGIGGTNKMFNYSPQICDVAYDVVLRCYNSPETGLINFGTVACDFTPVSEVTNDFNWSVFPNPFSGLISIQVESSVNIPLKYELFDYSGKRVQAGVLSFQHHEMDLSYLAAGIYFLQVLEADTPLGFEKIVKM